MLNKRIQNSRPNTFSTYVKELFDCRAILATLFHTASLHLRTNATREELAHNTQLIYDRYV